MALESIGSNLANAVGFSGVLRMIWSQTKPIFQPPHLTNIIMLSYLMIALYGVSHGFGLWCVYIIYCIFLVNKNRIIFVRYPQILNFHYGNMDKSLTMCEAAKIGYSISTNTNASNLEVPSIFPKKNYSGNALTFITAIIYCTFYVAVYALVAFNIKRLPMKYILGKKFLKTFVDPI